MKDNRRDFIKKSASLAAAVSVTGLNACTGSGKKDNENVIQKIAEWPITEGPDTPKLCVGSSANADEKHMRQIKQMGTDYVVMGGPRIPWNEDDLRAIMDRFKAQGLVIINMSIGRPQNSIFGQKGRDDEIEEVQESLRAAGAVGLPVVEYNFIVDRLIEGYYEKKGRGDVDVRAFNYASVKDLPAKPEIGTYTSEQLWDNLTYFLKAVIPVAEKAGVRMALHPNDPPIPISHGSVQIIATFKDWKRLIEIVDSPSNGMTFDCGIAREMGEDPLEVLRYLGSRDRINHVHFRNVLVNKPYAEYTEVFMDEGQVNLFAIMRELIKIKYKYGLYPEHPNAFDYDKEHPEYIPGGRGYTGQTYNLAFAHAMKLAVLSM